MSICEPSHHCRWKDSNGKYWFMDWTGMGPVFSADNFEDGGIDLRQVPLKVRQNAEKWAYKVLGIKIILTTVKERRTRGR